MMSLISSLLRRCRRAAWLLLLALVFSPALRAAEGAAAAPREKGFGSLVESAVKHEGLFNLYLTNQNLYAEITPAHLDKPYIAPMAIARGMAMAGQPLNFGDEWILVFRRAGDRVQLLRRNIHYTAPEKTPLQKAVQQNYSDSVLLSLPIVHTNNANRALIVDFANIFLTDFAELGLGNMDRNRSSFAKVKAFPNNVEIQVEATFSGRGSYAYGDVGDGVVDGRGITLVIHYSLARLPEAGYKPRHADHRVGHFLNATIDFGSDNPDTSFVRMVNRWRLEKVDPKARLSPPKKQIVWWVEDNVPQEFRPYVEEGILEWNKAFEKIGFRNALAVRWQNERDEFDPEDINYCTFRWITTSSTFAMSALRSNPLTGEMIDGDVIFDASWIRYWKREYAVLVANPSAVREGELVSPLDVGEIISPIMAAKHGFGLPLPLAASLGGGRRANRAHLADMPELVPSNWSPTHRLLSRRMAPGKFTACHYISTKHFEMSLAAMALAAAAGGDASAKLPEEFLGQNIKEVVMHEVGHSLGLRHNFKASSMLPLEQVNDPAITRQKGMVGSVMDYNPINIAPKGQKQGDWTTTTIGPYDYWAIEYAYAQFEGNEAEELKKIAARSPESDLVFGTDEDMYLSDDPLINTYDLGNDPLKYAQQRVALAAELARDLDQRVVKDGESWARLRNAFNVLLSQFGNGAYLATAYIGGQSVARDFKGTNGRDPIVPVPGEKQREALKFAVDEILSDKAFQFSPALLRRLTQQHWYHWGNDSIFSSGSMDYNLYDRIAAIHRIVLNQCLNAGVFSRLQNQALLVEADSKPLQISELFQSITDGVWSDLGAGSSPIRRNLQREHLNRLATLVLGSRRNAYQDYYSYVVFLGSSSIPADAKSLARMHLTQINERIGRALNGNVDETTRAHLLECRQRISKALDPVVTAGEL